MTAIDRSALVPYSADQMFDVVLDVERYPQFLPWCSGASVIELTDDHQLGELELSRAGISLRFTTRNELARPERIGLSLICGPFRQLTGEWRFRSLGDAGCKVELHLSFEMEGRMQRAALGQLWRMAADRMVDAFCERAENLYG